MAAEMKEESRGSAAPAQFQTVLKQLEQNSSRLSPEKTCQLIEDCQVIVKNVLSPEVPSAVHPSEVMSVLKIFGILASGMADGRESIADLLLRLLNESVLVIDQSLIAGTTLAKCLFHSSTSLSESCARTTQLLSSSGHVTRLCIVSGVLNYTQACHALFVSEEKAGAQLGEIIIQQVLEACSSHAGQAFQFQAFQALRTLTHRMNEVASKCTTYNFIGRFVCQSKEVESLLDLIMGNWQNPGKGVADLAAEAFSHLLDVCRKVDPTNYPAYVQSLLANNLQELSWSCKSKYPPLVVLIPRVGVTETLSSYPQLGACLSESLSSTHLAPIGASVYRTLLKEANADLWRQHLQPSLIQALCSSSSVVRMNAKNLWLSPTVTAVASSAALLDVALSSAPAEDEALSLTARLLVAKLDREKNGADLGESQLRLVESGLRHLDSDVRCAAFAALCHCQKKAHPPSELETELVEGFLRHNLVIDSSAFRQAILRDFTLFLIRCRDALVLRVRKNKIGAQEEFLIRKLHEMLNMAFANCYPGANYQRQITCLEILGIFSSLFFHYQSVGVNKQSGNGDPRALVQHCRQKQLFCFETEEHLLTLLSCAQYYMSDVQELSRALLAEFSPGPELIRQVVERAVALTRSPRAAECEAAAGFFKLCILWTRRDPAAFQDMIQVCVESAVPTDLTVPCTNLTMLFLQCYEDLLERAKANLLLVATSSPMHGLLTCLRFCLSEETNNVEGAFLERLIKTLDRSTTFMLGFLSAEASVTSGSASFADMSEAIANVVESEEGAVEISDEHSLVLACAWLNLKECAKLSALLPEILLAELSSSQVSECGQILVTIMTRSRHKGVMEASGLALGQFSTALLTSVDSRDHSGVPMTILTDTLKQIETYSASITRRSAGLPLLIQQIVSSEPRGRFERKLLPTAVNHLLRVANTHSASAETSDVPQTHALHILRSLVEDSSLAVDVARHLAELLRCCAENFSSASWCVRNAALQLFGALVPRILGQKKVRTEEALHNTLTLAEFASRYNELLPFIVSKLNETHSNLLVNPALVPLLSMLARVTCSATADPALEDVIRDFKTAFYSLLSSPVINVRQLTSRAFASFTPTLDIKQEIINMCHILQRVRLSTNMQHGVLCCIKELTKRFQESCKQEGTENDLCELLSGLKVNSKCYLNKALLLNIKEIWNLDIEENQTQHLDADRWHPGFHIWHNRSTFSQNANDENSVEMIDAIGQKPSQIVDFLCENIDEKRLNGLVVERCHLALQSHASVLLEDSELALEVIDAVCNGRISNGDLGTSARASSLLPASLAFSSMLTQDDFAMFFQDTSPYVSLFVEFTEMLLGCSTPLNVETSRMYSAQALLNVRRPLKQRPMSDLPIVMRYGFVNLLNAGLVLLSDEDCSVRNTAEAFAMALRVDGFEDASPRARVIAFGLVAFTDCHEWFSPVIDLVLIPWRDGDEALSTWADSQKKKLFENGEGINVYAEKVTENMVCHEVLRRWMDSPGAKSLGININLDKLELVAETVVKLIKDCQEQKKSICFSQAWTAQGYLLLTRLYNLLNVICANSRLIICNAIQEPLLTRFKIFQEEIGKCLLLQ